MDVTKNKVSQNVDVAQNRKLQAHKTNELNRANARARAKGQEYRLPNQRTQINERITHKM